MVALLRNTILHEQIAPCPSVINWFRMRIFVDDKDVTGGGLDLGYGRAEVLASAEHGGLFLGGLPGDVRREKERIDGVVASSLGGFVGTIKDLAFIDDRSVYHCLACNKSYASLVTICMYSRLHQFTLSKGQGWAKRTSLVIFWLLCR